MVQRKIEKTAAIALILVILLIALFFSPDYYSVGLHTLSPWQTRFVYQFIHASFIHALLNSWCLAALVFILPVSLWKMILAYIIAVLAPSYVISSTPTVGLSVILFALFGLLTPVIPSWKRWLMWCVANIAVGFVIPCVNGAIHAYAFIIGLIIGSLNAPISCKKK